MWIRSVSLGFLLVELKLIVFLETLQRRNTQSLLARVTAPAALIARNLDLQLRILVGNYHAGVILVAKLMPMSDDIVILGRFVRRRHAH